MSKHLLSTELNEKEQNQLRKSLSYFVPDTAGYTSINHSCASVKTHVFGPTGRSRERQATNKKEDTKKPK